MPCCLQPCLIFQRKDSASRHANEAGMLTACCKILARPSVAQKTLLILSRPCAWTTRLCENFGSLADLELPDCATTASCVHMAVQVKISLHAPSGQESPHQVPGQRFDNLNASPCLLSATIHCIAASKQDAMIEQILEHALVTETCTAQNYF